MESEMKKIHSQHVIDDRHHQIRQNIKTNLHFILKHINEIESNLNKDIDIDIWMIDKISTARNDIGDVNMGLKNKE